MVEENHVGEKAKENEVKRMAESEFVFQIIAISILALILAFNFGKLSIGGISGLAMGIGTVSASEIIPTGVPEVYGKEIGVSYDGVSPSNPQLADATINKMRAYEDMELNDEQLQRYINIASEISCEYCCGAKSIIFDDGSSACGCAHSYAMRGLAKYMVINHPEVSEEDVLIELGKWKVLFFPGIHEDKAQVMKDQGIDVDYISLTTNEYRGIEKGQASGGMVGGC